MYIEATKSHEGSNSHLFVANKHANEQKPSEAHTLKARLSLNKALFPKLQHLFHIVHAIYIKGRPHNDYKWLGELDVGKGLILEIITEIAYLVGNSQVQLLVYNELR